jgi:putative PIN family toxin of toxin-antitoxin system
VECEIREVLARPKFARHLTDEDRSTIMLLLTEAAVWVEPTLTVHECRDAKDNKYLALAAAAGADIIMSSDNDLLVLDPWSGIRIVRPADFLAMA